MSAKVTGNCNACWFCREGHPERCLFPAKKKTFSDQTATGVVTNMSKADKAIMKNGQKGGGKKSSFTTTTEKCAYKHPPLKIIEGVTVVGGSAEYPLSVEHDIYVSLNGYHPTLPYPWQENFKNPILITYNITDMNAPKDAESFKKLVSWLSEQAKAGKSIHVGCMGGHGRTGTLLAALVKEIAGIEDAITYVRKHYCEKAVESTDQVNFLHAHYGIKKQKGYKTWTGGNSGWWSGDSKQGGLWGGKGTSSTSHASSFNEKHASNSPDQLFPVKPMRYLGNIWGMEAPTPEKTETKH